MPRITWGDKHYTEKDALDAFARFDSSHRASFTKWRKFAIKHDGKQYPPKAILRLMVGDIGNLTGGEPTNRYFKDLGFEIVRIDEDDDEPVPPSTDVDDAVEITLHLESDLERFLAADLGQLEKGLRLYTANGSRGQQCDAGAAGRIDLLAVDGDGNLVVLELKAGEADRQVCSQTQAYMGWVMDHLADGRPVRGIIVAASFTERAKLAVKVVPTLSLRTYSVAFRFGEA